MTTVLCMVTGSRVGFRAQGSGFRIWVERIVSHVCMYIYIYVGACRGWDMGNVKEWRIESYP